jgi:hypothetical protein
VEQELPRQLTEALSGRLTPKGAALTVRIDSLTIGPNKDSRAWDNISGVATIGGVARPVRATSRYWASAIDQARFEQSNHARVSAVAQALAVWIVPRLSNYSAACAGSHGRSPCARSGSALGAGAFAFFDPESHFDTWSR